MTGTNEATAASSRRSRSERLPRVLTVFGGVLLTLSCITPGSSLFILVPELVQTQGTGVVLTLVLAAVISAGVALCYGELGTRFPIAGGEYSIVSRVLGRGAGWLTFVLSLGMIFVVPPVIALGTADYLASVVELPVAVTGAAVMLVATLIALLDVRSNALVTGTFLAVEVLAAALVAGFGFAHAHRPVSALLTPTIPDATGRYSPFTWGVLLTGLAVGMFTFQGFSSAVYLSEELKQPERSVVRTVMWSLVASVLIIGVPTVAVVLGTGSDAELAGADFIAIVDSWGGPVLSTFVGLSVAAAILNAVIVMVLQNARVLYASARDQAWPEPVNRVMTKLHPRWKSPWAATLVAGLPAAALAGLVSSETLVGVTGVIVAGLYLAIAVAALRARRTPSTAGWRMPLWPVPAVLTISAIVLALANQAPADLAITAGALALAATYYAAHLRRHPNQWSIVGN
ncbi:APC family permease [Saccharopolyspora mangrovi]|uniref:APC family permease n=1 Tax=Saccharopolyspora mangrovi TaxID=3082379 RepID=A0ABU6ABM7_9PSEU|nr:APC family permease [Saccharopolyspora sp. S2-29]MEB3368950.1 APC family permease [Saccharopolyspora sp. S2-29]